jgi:hypothetical protein
MNRFNLLEDSSTESNLESSILINSVPLYSKSISNSSGDSAITLESKTDDSNEAIAEESTGWQVVTNKKKTDKEDSSTSNNNNNQSSDSNLNLYPRSSNPEMYNLPHVEFVKNLIETNTKTMIILRGCSGSGKSTLAR